MIKKGQYRDYISRSIISGVLVGIGGTVYLSSGNRYIGSCLFSLALIMIIYSQYKLYTSRIAYLLENPFSYILTLIITFVGNFIGVFLIGFSLYFTDLVNLVATAQTVMDHKMGYDWYTLLVLGFWCGVLIWIGVEGAKRVDHHLVKLLVIVMAIMIFILCGFEHCIANMYYLVVSGSWSIRAWYVILMVLIGNSLGSISCWLINQLLIKEKI